MNANFPSMIEWIEQTGFTELRERHERCSHMYMSFDDFVNSAYNADKLIWEHDMCYRTKLTYEMDDEQDMCIESAKYVLVKIINDAISKGDVVNIIDNEELAPDRDIFLHVVNIFMNQLIPAVDRMLKGLK